MPLYPRMADSITPALIPEVFDTRDNGVAAYANGPHAWSSGWVRHFPRRRSITIEPVRLNKDAAWCAIMDVEQDDCVPADVPEFYEARKGLVGADAQVIIYCDRSTVPGVVAAVKAASIDPAALLYWIATLDNYKWSAAALAANIVQTYGVPFGAGQVWAVQWRPAGSYDESVVYGAPEWEGNK